MAVDYRFTGTNIDAMLVTDGPTGARTFFVTELRGYDPADIMAGIDLEVQEYHEADFVQMARDRTLNLFRIDGTGEFCLVMQDITAGRFNGTTSNLQVANVTLASSQTATLPWTFRATCRFTGNDLMNLEANGELGYTILSTNLSLTTQIFIAFVSTRENGIFFRFRTSRGMIEQFSPYAIPLNMCIEIEIRLSSDNVGLLYELMINGNPITSMVHPNILGLDQDDYTFTYGAALFGTSAMSRYTGIMRNLFFSDGSGTLINIADPSTGANTGSEADGTASNITQVTVIV